MNKLTLFASRMLYSQVGPGETMSSPISTKKGREGKKDESWIGPRRLTRYEKARILGARALQISMGAPVLIEVDETDKKMADPIYIAEEEIAQGVLPVLIRRKLPDGRAQEISLKKLLSFRKIET